MERNESPAFVIINFDKKKYVIKMTETIQQTLTGMGDGLGAFLNAIYLPLGNLLLILGIVGGIASIFVGIAVVIKKALK